MLPTLKMKGWWESNINVWFPLMYFHKWNCAASLFPKQNNNVLSPYSYTYISARDLYVYFQDRSVYFAAAKYADQSYEYMNCSQTEAALFLFWEYILDIRYSVGNNLDELLVPFLHMVTILTSYRTSFVTKKTIVHPDSNISEEPNQTSYRILLVATFH